jgi:hypothetical protein
MNVISFAMPSEMFVHSLVARLLAFPTWKGARESSLASGQPARDHACYRATCGYSVILPNLCVQYQDTVSPIDKCN